MKIFRLFKNSNSLSFWSSSYRFYCRGGKCNKCKYRFLCYTNSNIINIVDFELVKKLERFGGRHSGSYNRNEVRKIFFEKKNTYST